MYKSPVLLIKNESDASCKICKSAELPTCTCTLSFSFISLLNTTSLALPSTVKYVVTPPLPSSEGLVMWKASPDKP